MSKAQQERNMRGQIRRFLLAFVACVWGALCLLSSQGGCSLRALSIECYRCPCGSPAYGCINNRCVLLSNINSLSAAQLSQYITSKCLAPAADGGGQVDTAPVVDQAPCQCPAGQECDPLTGQCRPAPCQCPAGQECVPGTQTCRPLPCPNNDPRLPDGGCPPKPPCEGVSCPSGEACDPGTGQCVKVTCDPAICQPPKCCAQADGACIDVCQACASCPMGYTCNQDLRRCVRDSTSCRPTGSCIDESHCCGRRCVRVKINIGTMQQELRGCDCATNEDCAPGAACIEVPVGTGRRKMCSCVRNADCIEGGMCINSGGVRACVYR